MGLDFSHGDAHWSYGNFAGFRRKLSDDGSVFDYNNILCPLLIHSDCEGELSVKDCKKIAPILREIVSKWVDDDYDRVNGLRLADGMDMAAAQNVPLLFQ